MYYIVFVNFYSFSGLICHTCNTAATNDACNTGGNTVSCSNNQVCKNEIRDNNGNHQIMKSCKDSSTCFNEEARNADRCHPATSPSLCSYCCSTDLCNEPEIPSDGQSAGACIDPLGVEDGTIPSDQLTVSSVYNDHTWYGADRGRLNAEEENAGYGGWSAKANDSNPWIQADLGILNEVTGVITQGSNDWNEWVTSYEVHHSVDNTNFQPVTEGSGQTAVFTGNSDQNTAVTNMFHTGVFARYIRIHPTDWNEHISLRFEVLGCPDTEQPILTCPSDAILNTVMGAATVSTDYSSAVTASDNSAALPTISPDPASVFPVSLGIGAQDFTFTATDLSGNANTCTFTITVQDTEQPTMTCPSDVILNTDIGAATVSIDYSSTVTASDNSAALPTISPDPLSVFPVSLGIGAQPFTFTATDSSANTNTCTFTVTVQDTENPTLTCPFDTTVDITYICTDTALVDYSKSINASDNSGTVPNISPDPTTLFPAILEIGSNPFTFTVTDSSGNTNNCTFTIKVQDLKFRFRTMVHKHKSQSKNYVMIAKHHTHSVIQCGLHCLRDPLCVSVQFGNGICQLHGISEEEDESYIITNNNMVHYENTQ
ncbi:SCO-spondin-like [Anneissia japonica]|uniref:SCO-spondin-like n=1 Tax=Anneissia japonica TaxID=1529436 RepID=UPI00142564A5|nr:SCO-spondin-like [Anneissia japonica]